jgi:hypothetical protein
MAKNINAVNIQFPAGMLIGQALSLGILNMNTVVSTGIVPESGLGVAIGGVDSVQGPGGTTSSPTAAVGGGAQVGGNYATIGDSPAVSPGVGGTPGATAALCAGNVTIGQLLSAGVIQQSDLCSAITFATIPVQGGD